MHENNWVVKANKFIEAKGRLGILEQKFMGALISEISTDDKDFKDYKIDVREVAEFLNLNSKAVYEQIKTVTRNLRKKEIFIEEEDEKGKKSFLVTGFLSSAQYKEGEGFVEVRIDPNLKPYLIAINGKETYFTKYMIKNILKLHSSHSIRLYEFLKQHEKMRKREVEINQLKDFLGITDEYKRFYDFERYVLSSAKDEINEKTDIWIDYEKIKKGRKIEKINFKIEPKFTEEDPELYETEEIKLIRKKTGLKDEKFNAKQITELYEIAVEKTERFNLDPYRYIELNYKYALKKSEKNLFSFLKSALEKDYAKAKITMIEEI